MTEKPLISFDYAIKYLLKDKGDYEIVEGFISALLNSFGYKNVKIITLLDTESNKGDSKSKRSLADVIVEDEEHRKYIIEIERNTKNSFIHKACFNTSRLIVDNLAERMDYTDIVKVFHISLLYFPVGKGAIHHGQTIIRELESKEKLTIHIRNPETNETIDATDILPEYFFISVPLFNDRLEKEMDDWLYVLKYDNIPAEFHSPYMQKIADKLSILKMTQAERENYNYYLKKLYNDRDELQAAEAKGEQIGIAKGEQIGIAKGEQIGIAKGEQIGIAKGEQIGIAKGEQQERKNLAHKMLKKGINVETISELTGLSFDEIQFDI